MANDTHVIHTQIVELQLADSTDAYAVQSKAGEFVREEVHPALERVWSDMYSPDQYVIVDRMELNLESINSDELPEKLTSPMMQRIREAVADQISGSATNGQIVRILQESQYYRELLEYFLAHGELPWWGAGTTLTELERYIHTHPGMASEEWLAYLRQLFGNPEQLSRAVYQLTDQTLSRIASLLCGESLEELVLSLQLIAQRSGLITVSHRKIRRITWNALFQRLLHTELPAAKRELVSAVLMAFAREEQTGYPALIRDMVESGEDVLVGADKMREYLEDELNRNESAVEPRDAGNENWLVQKLTPDQADEILELHAYLLTILGKGSLPISAERELSSHLWDIFRAKLADLHPEESVSGEQVAAILASLAFREGLSYAAMLRSLSEVFHEAEEGNPLLELFLDSRAGEIEEPAVIHSGDRPDTGEKLVAANAGVILLWPFLQSLYTKLELSAENRFPSGEAHATAVLLLHYLATGETDIPEYELTLSKVICNWHTNAPLPRYLNLTEEMEMEANALLVSVVEHWSALKNTSAEGLRATYLRRPGLLQTGEDKYLLQIERNAFDMLLHKLPWTFSMVNLPWMSRPMEVEW